MSNSFEKTCTEIFVNGNVLSATCQKLDKSPNKTSIVLMGIENIDGELKVTDPNKPSSFHLSCTEIFVNGNVLSATCQKLDKSLNKTSIVLNGLENIDGELKYTSNVTDINSKRKAKMSNYVVISKAQVLLGRGGFNWQDLNFTLPDSVNLDSSAVLILTVDTYPPGQVYFRIDFNGKTVTSASYSMDVCNALQAIVEPGVLRTGANVATLKLESGDGSVGINNIVLWFKYREY